MYIFSIAKITDTVKGWTVQPNLLLYVKYISNIVPSWREAALHIGIEKEYDIN